ncbi:hypothetical protein K7X08_035052 [Anisodus acutangulus]|uniref:Uncharacterized protein n=1 Tax=Anisodus acutangulus TaxID=402998 RepID=A0A9Q1LJX9_9SOLA|nr:hypothetical protein K7X08_035052 [Anisodus acutangulus]
MTSTMCNTCTGPLTLQFGYTTMACVASLTLQIHSPHSGGIVQRSVPMENWTECIAGLTEPFGSALLVIKDCTVLDHTIATNGLVTIYGLQGNKMLKNPLTGIGSVTRHLINLLGVHIIVTICDIVVAKMAIEAMRVWDAKEMEATFVDDTQNVMDHITIGVMLVATPRFVAILLFCCVFIVVVQATYFQNGLLLLYELNNCLSVIDGTCWSKIELYWAVEYVGVQTLIVPFLMQGEAAPIVLVFIHVQNEAHYAITLDNCGFQTSLEKRKTIAWKLLESLLT